MADPIKHSLCRSSKSWAESVFPKFHSCRASNSLCKSALDIGDFQICCPTTLRRSALDPCPSLAVVVCGSMWGVFWYPLRWSIFDSGVGAGWVAIVFNAVCTLVLVPWVFGARPWEKEHRLYADLPSPWYGICPIHRQPALTDVVHAILLFYLTPMWSTLVGLIFLGQRLNFARALSMLLGLAVPLPFSVLNWLPIPHNIGDWLALISGMLWAVGTLRSFLRPAPVLHRPFFRLCHRRPCFVVHHCIAVDASRLATLQHRQSGSGAALDRLVGTDHLCAAEFSVLWAARRNRFKPPWHSLDERGSGGGSKRRIVLLRGAFRIGRNCGLDDDYLCGADRGLGRH